MLRLQQALTAYVTPYSNCEDYFHLHSLTAVHSYDLYHIHVMLSSYMWLYARITFICIIIIIYNLQDLILVIRLPLLLCTFTS